MKFAGTALISLKDIINNIKNIAGTCTITRSEFDNNNNKICSYSYINKIYELSWNKCLNIAHINTNRVLPLPMKQGRKSLVKEKYIVECLSCDNKFNSIDPKLNRICDNCKQNIDFKYDDL